MPSVPRKPPPWIVRDSETPCSTCLAREQRRRLTTRSVYGESQRPTLEALAHAWIEYQDGPVPDWAFARWQDPIRAAIRPRRNDLRRLDAMSWLGAWLWNRVVPVPDYPIVADYPEDGGAPHDPDGDYGSALDEDSRDAERREVFEIDESYTVGEWVTREGLWPILMYGVEHDWPDDDLALACQVRMSVSEMDQHPSGFDTAYRVRLQTLAGLRV